MSRCECCQAAVAHVEALTPTETTVLTLLAKGLTTKELAKMLGGAPYTVNDHIVAGNRLAVRQVRLTCS